MSWFKKLSKVLALAAFLILGMGTGYLFNVSEAEASSGCYYSYCSGSQCASNYNATNCLGPGGTEPCTSSAPCEKNPWVE